MTPDPTAQPREDPSGLIFALTLDPEAPPITSLADLPAGTCPAAPLWVHLNRTSPQAVGWLQTNSGIPEFVTHILLASQSRPRWIAFDDALLLILRGVDITPVDEPEDLVSLRIWVATDRVITLRREALKSVDTVRRQLEAHQRPGITATGQLLIAVLTEMLNNIDTVIEQLIERTDDIEEQLFDLSTPAPSNIADTRRAIIALRRHIHPQRDVLVQLRTAPFSWLTETDRNHLRELADRMSRVIEEIDELRDRLNISQEELSAQVAAQTNRTTFRLTVIAAIFLPLGFLTGLLGINVAGIPGAEHDRAFLIVTLALIALIPLQLVIYRKLRWL